MTLPTTYPTPKVPMYIVTIVEPTGRLIGSGYHTRAELIKIIEYNQHMLNTQPILDDDDYITQSLLQNNGNFFIITTIYLQISNNNE
jgi:hypothetical protein